MREASSSFAAAVVDSHVRTTAVESWRGGELLVDSIPVEQGEQTYDDTSPIPGEVSITVPGREWDPTGDPWHPLAPFGQRLYVSTGIRHYTGEEELLGLGWYLITDADPDPLGRGVRVRAQSLERLLADDRLVTPMAPLAGGTLLSEAYRITRGRVPFEEGVPAGVTDRAVPADTVWEGDRLSALSSIAGALPARFRVDDTGLLRILPPAGTTGTPVLELRTGERGVVAEWSTRVSRDEVYNAVVVTGEDNSAERRPLYATAIDDDPASPTFYGGPYGRRQREYSSPLITTNAAALTAARSVLDDERRKSRTALVTMVPDPRLEPRDWVTLSTPTVSGLARVSSIRLPLHPAGGPATLTVEVV